MHVYKYGVHGEKAVVGIVMNVMNRLTKIKEVKWNGKEKMEKKSWQILSTAATRGKLLYWSEDDDYDEPRK